LKVRACAKCFLRGVLDGQAKSVGTAETLVCCTADVICDVVTKDVAETCSEIRPERDGCEVHGIRINGLSGHRCAPAQGEQQRTNKGSATLEKSHDGQSSNGS
jgi:hypothetical protein